MITKPYLIFVGDTPRSTSTKTARGVADWSRDDCLAQWRLSDNADDLSLPEMDPPTAARAGARSMLVGVSPVGGVLPAHWIGRLVEALEAGLDLVSGLHTRLDTIEVLHQTAQRCGRRIWDVRYVDRSFPLATGRKRRGKRLLTVGTDCALGKKYTAIAIARAMQGRGLEATFRATGQTGIMIAGEGVAVDAVIADFIAGASETLSPDAANHHWDVIEGQGAIFHPAYAGVTLGLLHGSQPDVLILCHDPTRLEISSFPGFPIRPLQETMKIYETLAHVTNPKARFAAISLNTSAMGDAEAKALALQLEREHELVAFDPLRFGLERALDAVLSTCD
jgi:uncharacterized NAD-dependent epimerase/dehydratase family protein